jgi:pyruvate/2-oxoglutarate dehydrogenase complex dihydrolipoamide acyltransferase (E2) component
MTEPSTFDVFPISPSRALVVDAGFLASKRHISHGLIEVDISEMKKRRVLIEETTGEKLSFTAYLVACLARAVAADPQVQAYRKGRKLVVFHDVDVVTMVEPQKGAVAIPHIIRNANALSVKQISDEIRSIQANPEKSEQQSGKLISLAPKIPRWCRLLFFQWMKRDPERIRRMQGTVIMTSVGMFGKGGGWGLTYLPLHTLGVTVGGIQTKPAFVNDTVVPREYLSLTLAFDHDIVDGAPAARFAKGLVELIESASLLDEKVAANEEQ